MTRTEFLAAVARRADNIADPNLNPEGPWRALGDHEADQLAEDAAHLDATAAAFADAVDTENATWQRTTRVLAPLPYEEAVVIDGDTGRFVTHRDTYTRLPVSCEARAGEVTSVLRGDVLLGWTVAQ